MTLPAAVLFDLDGTLVDSERENVESVVLAVRRYGIEMTAAEKSFVVGHSWNEIHEGLVRVHGLAVSKPRIIAEAVEEKRALLRDGHRPLPGAVDLVRRLARRSKLAVVSGASRVEVRDAVEGVGLADAFTVLLGAEDYGRGKPEPEPYVMAMERLGARPEQSLVIEDAAPGIAAARAAGVRVIGVRAGNFSGYDLGNADAVVDTLLDVTDDLIERVLAR